MLSAGCIQRLLYGRGGETTTEDTLKMHGEAFTDTPELIDPPPRRVDAQLKA